MDSGYLFTPADASPTEWPDGWIPLDAVLTNVFVIDVKDEPEPDTPRRPLPKPKEPPPKPEKDIPDPREKQW